jgi:hypothetical protein
MWSLRRGGFGSSLPQRCRGRAREHDGAESGGAAAQAREGRAQERRKSAPNGRRRVVVSSARIDETLNQAPDFI